MPFKSFIITFGIFFAGFILFPLSSDADTESELRDAVSSLNSWLGADQKASRWRQVLKLNVLDSQAALGHRANPIALMDVARCFEESTGDSDHPVFKRVMASIDAHLKQLQFNQLSIANEAARMMGGYKNLQVEDFERLRKEAIYKIRMLKRFYKSTIRSRERAELFYEFRPDETISFLEGIEFEVAPERSRDAIREEIETVEQMIAIIEKQIEELNAQRSQIEEWIDKVRRPQDALPPSPDDGDDAEDELRLDDELQMDDTSKTRTAAKPSQQQVQQIEEIERGEMSLMQQLARLEQEVEILQDELDELTEIEKERGLRLRTMRRSYSDILEKWEAVGTLRNDAYFSQAYISMIRLETAYIAAARPSTPKEFEQRLEKLQELNAELESDPNNRLAAAQLGLVSGWIDGAGQAKNLVAAVRSRYSNPNIFLEVSNALANQFVSRKVSESELVNEQVLNRLIRGVAKVDGEVKVQFVPDPYQVQAAIDFTGSIHSDTFVRSGKLTAYAGADAPFNIRRDFFANVGGMFARDVYGDVQLDTYFKCIDSNLRLVQKIANKQYLKTKAQAEAISLGNLNEKLLSSFAEETDPAVEAGLEQFDSFSRRQTDFRKLIPATYMFTTADRMVVVGHKATPYDLAAPTKPQMFANVPADVHVKLHETALSNYISPILAGRRLTNFEILEQVQRLTSGDEMMEDEFEGEEEFDDEEDQEGVISILFDDARPIQLEFENDVLAVTISGKEFSRDGKKIKDGLRIRLAFKLVNKGEFLELVPAEAVKVELMDDKQTNVRTVTFKTFLEDSLNALLEEAGDLDFQIPLNLIPSDNFDDALKRVADAMKLVQFKLQSGWLYLGWKYQANEQFMQLVTDTSAISYPEAAPELDPSQSTDGDDAMLDTLENSEATQ